MMTNESALLQRVPTGLFIDGLWSPGSTGENFTVANPGNGEVIAEVSSATPADAVRALDAADEAAAGWAATPARTRSVILRRAFDLLQERRDDFALLMTLEMGKPLAEAYGEIAYGGEFLRWFSEEAVRISGRFGATPEGSGHMVVSQHALGPCYLITPWNFPLAMATRKIAPALAAGCTIVLKPAALTPLTTLLFTKLLVDAGVPKGVVNVIPTSASVAVSEPILRDSRLRKISFTGSTEVGRALLRQSADGVLRSSMELGGNAPFIVFADADIDLAVSGAMAAKFRNIGQACTAANRFYVHEDIAEEFTNRVTVAVAQLRLGLGTEDGVRIGPLINDAAVKKVSALVDDAVSRGARIRIGGSAVKRAGSFYEATVVDGVVPGSAILREEIFGPVMAISTFSTEDEVVSRANDTEYGLAGYVFTRDLARGTRMIDRLQSGMLGLNTGVLSNAAAPFGGIKQSGIGREGGAEGLGEYLVTKYTLISHG